jgi:hypothetical protein
MTNTTTAPAATQGTRTAAHDLTPGALVHGTRYVVEGGATTPVDATRRVLSVEPEGERVRVVLGAAAHGEGPDTLTVVYYAAAVLVVTPAPRRNPVLVAARENWDKGHDMWGQALAWLDAVDNMQAGFGYADAADAEAWGASWERIAVYQLVQGDGSWALPAATEDDLVHAYRVFDRMADVARANGLDY